MSPTTPATEKKFRFAEATYSIESTPKSLRKWLQNDKVELVDSGDEEGWRDFSFADLVVLALMRKLVDFGVGVEEANGYARNIVETLLMAHLGHRKTPPAALVARFTDVVGLLWRKLDDDSWLFRLVRHDEPAPAAAYAVIDTHAVVKRVLERLVEITSDETVPMASSPIDRATPKPKAKGRKR